MAFGLKRVAARRGDALAAESWDGVERLLVEYCRGEGYAVEHCGTVGWRRPDLIPGRLAA
ncbi:hypothetical protein GCM10011394_10150 [Luteimonas terricola]|uniref:Resolvase/invertase-type recombinase catalytic domain-containing protein n=1 Tax=Luteimonas terricola TaxID=645597 RepID=A0ABQ2EDH0_9GAMM|nr:hypothetical protein GCM10011394_10150 [Luteimonas terricola]